MGIVNLIRETRRLRNMKCSNIWKLDGECLGKILHCRVGDRNGKIYDEDTKRPFEKSAFSRESEIPHPPFAVAAERERLAKSCQGKV
jgi:hypothetical protein